MAHSLETDPINQLEENLQCSVCLGTLTDPRTLPCCHSFCKDCLEGVVKTCRDKAARDGRRIREFPCPDCRAMFTLEPDKHVADMPRNHFICNMVQVIAVLDRGTRVPCSHNCSQSSVARCVTCEKFLCQECLTGHNNYRGHNDHSVLTMEELSKPENQAKINGTMYCNEHSGMPLKVYCETCDKLICTDCMLFKHVRPNHSCLLVKDVASNYKELLASNNKVMEDALTEGNRFLQQLSQKTAGLDGDVENAKRHIVQRREFMAKKVVELLNRKAETLLKEVEELHKSERAKLGSQTTEAKLCVENIKQSIQLSKKLLDQGTEEEVISSQKMMLENAKNLLRKRSEHFKNAIPVTKVSYTSCASISEEVYTALENSFGEVNKDTETKFSSNQRPALLTYSEAAARTNTESKRDDGTSSEDDECSLCLCGFTNKKTLKCSHSFCSECIETAFKVKRQCPICSTVYGPLIGDQPHGKMYDCCRSTQVPGFPSCGTIIISYRFPNGFQGPNHPKPGEPYYGTSRDAYLPNNEEGKKVLKLLKKAFDQKLTFTIGRSTTTGRVDVVTWNDIHHKTSIYGGPTRNGYPDPDYLKRVQEELAAKGITE